MNNTKFLIKNYLIQKSISTLLVPVILFPILVPKGGFHIWIMGFTGWWSVLSLSIKDKGLSLWSISILIVILLINLLLILYPARNKIWNYVLTLIFSSIWFFVGMAYSTDALSI